MDYNRKYVTQKFALYANQKSCLIGIPKRQQCRGLFNLTLTGPLLRRSVA